MNNGSRSAGTYSVQRIINFCAVAAALWCVACDPERVYEQNYSIPENQWYIDTIPGFQFTIQDTAQPYNIYYNVRYALSYPFYNLYVTYYLQNEQGDTLSSRLQNLILRDAQTGKPLGDGLGDIFDYQLLSLPNYRFNKKGTYTFKIKQYMRQDPLPDIMSIGVRVTKATQVP